MVPRGEAAARSRSVVTVVAVVAMADTGDEMDETFVWGL
jgi:hypothetical protein